MQRSIPPRWSGAFFFTLLLSLQYGCGGLDSQTRRELELEEERYQNARLRESLVESIEETLRLRDSVATSDRENKNVQAETARLTASLRTAQEEKNTVSAQRDSLAQRIKDMEEASSRLQESLDRVKSIASSSAGELTDLRVKSRELEDKLQVTVSASKSLREERDKLLGEVEGMQADLVRARAALRSVQEAKDENGGGHGLEYFNQVEKLEGTNKELRAENAALARRIERLEHAGRQANAAGGASQAAAGVYRDDPAGLVAEITGLLKDRITRAFQGEIAWDAFDITVVSGTGVLCLILLLPLFYRRRARRLRCRVEELEASVRALEEGARAAPQADVEVPEGSRRTPRRAPRRSGFSAVISRGQVEKTAPEGTTAPTAVADGGEAGEGDDEPVEDARGGSQARAAPPRVAATAEDPFERLLLRSGPKQAAAPAASGGAAAAGGRKIIGARSWEKPGSPGRAETASPPPATVAAPRAGTAAADNEAGAAGGDDELACTQLIPSLAEMDLQSAGASAPRPAAPEARRSAPARPARGTERMAQKPDQEKLEEDDKELLAELKSVINKKFDELLK